MTIRMRRAERRDVPVIVRLIAEGGPEGPRNAPLVEGHWVAFERIDADPRQLLMVAEMEQAGVVGTLQITWLTNLSAAGRDDCLLESVHVDAALRGQGIGAQMIEWAIAEARAHDCRRVQLTTNKLRLDAHRFYRRLGFAQSHEGMKLEL